MLGKNRRKKVKKTIFYSQEYLDQKICGKKRAKQFFQKQTNGAIKKCWKKPPQICVNKRFFYIQTNIVTKKWGKNARNNFSRNTRICSNKNVRKKIVAKIFEKNFFIHSNIVTKKWWEKMRETIFPETHEWFE